MVNKLSEFLLSRSRNELLMIVIGIPILGSLISRVFEIEVIHWASVAQLLFLAWQFGVIRVLNSRMNNLFDLRIARIFFVTLMVLMTMGVFRMSPDYLVNLMQSEFWIPFVILALVVNFSYFYLIFLLTRIHSLAFDGHDVDGIDLFPKYFYFLVYPIGIWKYQEKIRSRNDG